MLPHLTRRAFATGAIAWPAAAMLPTSGRAAEHEAAKIHRFDPVTPFPVNAYLVEGREGVVAIDATLTVTGATELRRRADALGKPMKAVLLTHPHPDHYAGLGHLTEGLAVPIIAIAEVDDIVRRDDAWKAAVINPMFGDEWPAKRVFPNERIGDGEALDFGPGLTFRVVDIGPAESFHDSIYFLEGSRPAAFVGDLVYSLMHPYMADGHNDDWRRVIARLSNELPEDLILHVGHGEPTTRILLAWQRVYLDRFDAALRAADWTDPAAATEDVLATMQDYLPTQDLVFLMQRSIEPNAKRLGLMP